MIGELEALVAQEPLRERLHALRMLALYRSGRQADALDAYRQARAALVEAIGVEPGPELRRLHDAILRQDPALDLPAPTRSCRRSSTPSRRWSAARPSWTCCASVAARRGGCALVAGAPGIGKTRLAAELAAEVQREGGRVLYASGAGAPDAARRVIERRARRAARRCSCVDD